MRAEDLRAGNGLLVNASVARDPTAGLGIRLDETGSIPSSVLRGGTATTLPPSPSGVQQVVLTDSLTAPTYEWLLQWSAQAAKWVFLGGSAQSAEVDTQEARNANTYGDCATVHSLTLVRPGVYDMTYGCLAQTASATNNSYFMSPKFSGSEAADADAVSVTTAAITVAGFPMARTRRITVAAAAQVVTMRYKQGTADVNTKVSNRFLKVVPVTLT